MVPVLVWLALLGDHGTFGIVLMCCLAGDVLDGAIARAFAMTSAPGALFDSVADALLFVAAAAGLVLLYPADIASHAVAFWSIPVAWLSENAAALIRYGRLSSFHTYLSRGAAVAMGVFGVVLFAYRFDPALLRVAAAMVVLATLEEFFLLYLLPQWTADVRGLFWVVSRADRDTESRGTPEAAPRG